jgi:hypothetical protein
MIELLDKLSSHDAVSFLILTSCFLIAFTSIVGSMAVKIVRSNNQTKLKQEMLARGMSADDIKAILDAGTKCR